jgi:hypothetical protein
MDPAPKRSLIITRTSMRAPKNDATYWRTQPFSARLAALEQIRQEFHHWKYGAQSRLQRVYSVVK